LGFQQSIKVLLFLLILFVSQFLLVLFKLKQLQQQLSLFQLFSFVLQPIKVLLHNVVTQVSQLSFFVPQQVATLPFVLIIQFCFFLR
jgi:hypothetical protein